MLLKDFVGACAAWFRHKLAYLIASAFIVLVVVGSLCLTSCATTEPGLERETQLYLTTSNTVNSLKQVVPYVPAPANTLLEGILAAGGALLALWATHLQRSLKELRNGNAGSTAAPGAAAGAPERPPGA